jgi:hypothetical protein
MLKPIITPNKIQICIKTIVVFGALNIPAILVPFSVRTGIISLEVRAVGVSTYPLISV